MKQASTEELRRLQAQTLQEVRAMRSIVKGFDQNTKSVLHWLAAVAKRIERRS